MPVSLLRTPLPLVLLTGTPALAEPPHAFEAALKESGGTFDALDEKGDWVDDLYGRAFFDMFPARRCRLTRDGAADAYTYACPASATNPQITARFEIDARRTGRLQVTVLSVTGQDTVDVVPVESGTKAPFDFAAAVPVPPPPPALLPPAFRDAFRRGGNVYYERDASGRLLPQTNDNVLFRRHPVSACRAEMLAGDRYRYLCVGYAAMFAVRPDRLILVDEREGPAARP